MRRLFADSLIVLTGFMAPAWAQQDQDTLCASVYALLAQNARTTGADSSRLEAAMDTAQNYHLAAYPGDDPQRYALSVIDGAEALGNAMAAGAVSLVTIVNTARSCDMRYHPR